eukprot:572090-Hanusia_phi.AAC.1
MEWYASVPQESEEVFVSVFPRYVIEDGLGVVCRYGTCGSGSIGSISKKSGLSNQPDALKLNCLESRVMMHVRKQGIESTTWRHQRGAGRSCLIKADKQKEAEFCLLVEHDSSIYICQSSSQTRSTCCRSDP